MSDTSRDAEVLVPLGVRALFRDEPIVRAAFELSATLGESREEALVRVIDSLHQALLTCSRKEEMGPAPGTQRPDLGAEHYGSPRLRELQSAIGAISEHTDSLLANLKPAEPIREELRRIARDCAGSRRGGEPVAE